LSLTAKIMKQKKILYGLTYRQAQKYNSEQFYKMSKERQLEARSLGYLNSGWDNVRRARAIVQEILSAQPIDMIKFAIERAESRYESAKQSSDPIEVLSAGKAVIQSLKLKYQ
jgi:hypothetical protein